MHTPQRVKRVNKENLIKLVRWENGPPCCFNGTYDEVRRKVEEDPRTKSGLSYVII